MNCDFEMLVRLLDKTLDKDLDRKLEVFDHLDRCTTCREAVYRISRDRDAHLYVAVPVQERHPSGRNVELLDVVEVS